MKNHNINSTAPAAAAQRPARKPGSQPGKNTGKKNRRGMTVAALTLALGTAVYLNWSFAQDAPLAVQATADGGVAEVMAEGDAAAVSAGVDTVSAAADTVSEDISADTGTAADAGAVAVFDELQPAEGGGAAGQTANKNYGEAQLVSVSKDSGSEFFEQARLGRAKARDEALEDIEKALKNSALTDEEKAELTAKLQTQLGSAAVESDLETLIKAKGFADCVVVVNAGSVDVTVMTENDALTAAEVTRIRDLVLDKCHTVTAQQITVTEVK